MVRLFAFLSFTMLWPAAFSQVTTGVYAGLDDYPGLLLEYRFSEKHAVQLVTPYRFLAGTLQNRRRSLLQPKKEFH